MARNCRLSPRTHDCCATSRTETMPVATPSNWCIRVNKYLRELVTEHATHNVGLWCHRRGLYKQRSSLFDWRGVHIDPSHMHMYFNRIHFAFINAIRHHYDHVHVCAILRSDKFSDLDTRRVCWLTCFFTKMKTMTFV